MKAWKEVEPMCFKAKIDSIRRAQTPENVSRFFIDLNDIAHAEFSTNLFRSSPKNL